MGKASKNRNGDNKRKPPTGNTPKNTLTPALRREMKKKTDMLKAQKGDNWEFKEVSSQMVVKRGGKKLAAGLQGSGGISKSAGKKKKNKRG
mmetsp:Transcript_10911/g.12838  ORF Transcript_10911/g.12838 Transcript_10911/m.12838 type:complete len:91 (-) Transcript_10911:23-295(-)|eukprot:CAMPEP_0197850794 /NCGR_PEP_ID=MMETSP1438-20131217/16397_1 /TAXON_ID=1461541 /ORGANISM="Pterosperma sp., Strain CCMP1384" /LENGTH=90 /DNA_ID=CAMNT_0043464149 /DNA_START=179 /DNA_END=451 /DNA_ORIENTATION=+